MLQIARHSSFRLSGIALGLALVAAHAPAFGQEFTRLGMPKESHLTASVTYTDLDLTTKDGRTVLRQRIRATARDICRQLGDNGGSVGMAFVCEDEAVRGAAAMERKLIAEARAASRSQPTATQAANSFGPVASAPPPR